MHWPTNVDVEVCLFLSILYLFSNVALFMLFFNMVALLGLHFYFIVLFTIKIKGSLFYSHTWLFTTWSPIESPPQQIRSKVPAPPLPSTSDIPCFCSILQTITNEIEMKWNKQFWHTGLNRCNCVLPISILQHRPPPLKNSGVSRKSLLPTRSFFRESFLLW